jgi:hypothetical protein
MIRCANILIFLWFFNTDVSVMAQALIPSTPQGNFGTGSLLNPSSDGTIKRHIGPTGKPCITVGGDARPQKVNPQIFDHVVLATNACPQTIKMDVCYYHSDHCIELDLPAYSRKEAMLGIMPLMNGFRYEVRERFNPLGPN